MRWCSDFSRRPRQRHLNQQKQTTGHGFIVSSSGYDDEDRLANWRLCETHDPIVDRHSVSEFAPAIYFQDGQQTIANYPSKTAATSSTYTYVYATYIAEPVMRGGSGGLRYYHRNQQYIITAVSDGGRTVVERYAYSAYGQVTIADGTGSQISNSAISNRYIYTGREWNEGLNLYHYRARMYDTVGGRFLGRDPIRFDGSPWNQYAYTRGNPISLGDPLGLSSKPRPSYSPFCLAAVAACAPIQITCAKTCYTMEAKPECMDRCCGTRGCRGSEVRFLAASAKSSRMFTTVVASGLARQTAVNA